MNKTKGQSAIEYLMNYAWAIGLIIIVGIAIFALDIGGIRTSIVESGSTAASASREVSITDFRYNSDGNLTLVPQNNGANLINITNFEAIEKDGNSLSGKTNSTDQILGPAETGDLVDINVEDSSTAGRSYNIVVEISYIDTETDITNKIRHTLQGSVQAA